MSKIFFVIMMIVPSLSFANNFLGLERTQHGWVFEYCTDKIRTPIYDATNFITKEKICEQKQCRPKRWIAPGPKKSCLRAARCELKNCKAKPVAKSETIEGAPVCPLNYHYDPIIGVCKFKVKETPEEALQRSKRFFSN